MPLDARTKMVAGAAELIGARGVGATSVRELAKFTGAPLGSTYHYFPGGKDQLVEESVAWVSGRVEKLLARSEGTADALEAFLSNWQQFLIASDYQASCPVLAVATEEVVTESTRDRPATSAFRTWHALLVDALRRDGVSEVRSAQLAWAIVASVEGAVVLSRSQRSPA